MNRKETIDAAIFGMLILAFLILIASNCAFVSRTQEALDMLKVGLAVAQEKGADENDDFMIYQGKIIAVLSYEHSTLVSVEFDDFSSLLLTLPEGSISCTVGETYEVYIKNIYKGGSNR